ncbi:glycosyltransferase [Patescibacteria group bacterium]|nr:glycosyltransferase [Patescibacteria group bacterium]
MKKVFLSVIIPAYNEEGNLSDNRFVQMLNWLKKQPFSQEVIIVDDGSTDQTAKLVAELIQPFKFARLIRNRHHGKPYTVKRGILESCGQLVLFSDFDQATPISEVKKLIKKARSGFDVVIGSREISGAKREKEPGYRHLMGLVFNFLVRLVVFDDFTDTQCGFKLFSQASSRAIFKRLYHYDKHKPKHALVGAFDVEVLYLAKKLGYKIAEVPVNWRHYKTKRINPLRDSISMTLEVLAIRFRDALGDYD